MSLQDKFIQDNEGNMTPQLAAQLLELGTEGDTGTTLPDEGGLPAASANAGANTDEVDASKKIEEQQSAANAAGTAEAELNADNAVILAKDGKHTIDYQKLVDARQAAADAKAQLETAQQQIASLQAEAQARADAGQQATKTDNLLAAAENAIAEGADIGLFGDFSEEAMAKGIAMLVDQKIAAHVAPLKASLEPIQQRQAVDATTQHYNSIYEKHPDADSIAESKELADWINSQPSFARDGYAAVLQQGSAQQVIELFDTFKQAAGLTQANQQQQQDGLKAAAAKAVAAAQAPIPASLSQIPGGKVGGTGVNEALANASAGADILALMENMTEDAREAFLNRQI